MCVVLGSFWSLHLDSSFCSGVTAEADVCCRDLCENQVLLVAAWFLLFLLPSPRCLGSLVLSCKREFLYFLSFSSEVLGAQRCIQSAFTKLTWVQFLCVSPDLAVEHWSFCALQVHLLDTYNSAVVWMVFFYSRFMRLFVHISCPWIRILQKMKHSLSVKALCACSASVACG